VRLEECHVPTLIKEHLQYVDLFPDWNGGVRRVLGAIRKQANRSRRDLLLAG
jgi:hypothetical protein